MTLKLRPDGGVGTSHMELEEEHCRGREESVRRSRGENRIDLSEE